MAINSKETHVTLDFTWEDNPDEMGRCSGSRYEVKYHFTNEMGNTISISDNNKDYYPFPAKLFVEVVDFLRSRGILDGSIIEEKKEKVAEKVVSKPRLPIPEITTSKQTVKTEKRQVVQQREEVEPEDEEEKEITGDPFESFTTKDDTEEVVVTTSKPKMIKYGKKKNKDIDEAQVLMERAEAKARAEASANKTKLKPAHKEGEIEEKPVKRGHIFIPNEEQLKQIDAEIESGEAFEEDDEE